MTFQSLVDIVGPKAGWVTVSVALGYILRLSFFYFSSRYVRRKVHVPELQRLTRLFGWRTQMLFTLIAVRITSRWMGYDPDALESINHWIGVGILVGVWVFLARALRVGRRIA